MTFEAAAQQYQRRIFSFAHYLLSNREEAEDVTQEVLLRLWRHREGVDEERLGTWLLRVTRNACYDLLRRRKAAAAHGTEESLDADEAPELPSPDTGPETRAEASDFRRHLLRALQELREPYKSVVILREVQGLSQKEISQALHIPEVTVRVHLHRARLKLREQLREVYSHDPT